MALMDNLGKRLGGAVKTLSKRTGEVAELSRLNSRLQSVRQNKDVLYCQIGKAVFEDYPSGGERDGVKVLCERIVEIQGEEKMLLRKIDKLRQQRRCEKCGDVQPDTAIFCSACGARLPEIPDDEPEPEAEPEAEPEPTHEEATAKSGASVAIDWPEAQSGHTAPAKPEDDRQA